MKRYWYILFLCLASIYACKDKPELLSNVINVSVDLRASPTTLDALNFDLRGVSLKGQAYTLDTTYTEAAGIYNLTNWTETSFQIAEFQVDYDSIQFIQVALGNENSILTNTAGQMDLPLAAGHDGNIIIPYGRYIQDLTDLSIELEFQSEESVLEQTDGTYLLVPKFIILN